MIPSFSLNFGSLSIFSRIRIICNLLVTSTQPPLSLCRPLLSLDESSIIEPSVKINVLYVEITSYISLFWRINRGD